MEDTISCNNIWYKLGEFWNVVRLGVKMSYGRQMRTGSLSFWCQLVQVKFGQRAKTGSIFKHLSKETCIDFAVDTVTADIRKATLEGFLKG